MGGDGVWPGQACLSYPCQGTAPSVSVPVTGKPGIGLCADEWGLSAWACHCAQHLQNVRPYSVYVWGMEGRTAGSKGVGSVGGSGAT